jgi:hypothetical protein
MSEPAFPGGNPSRYDGRIADGLTKREWFAGMALQGWLASWHDKPVEDYEHIAEASFAIADAMLAASKEPKP